MTTSKDNAVLVDDEELNTDNRTSNRGPQTKSQPFSIFGFKLEGFNILLLSAVVFTVAVTIALIISIACGMRQLHPHGALYSGDEQCSRLALEFLQNQKGNAIDSAVSALLCNMVTRPDAASAFGCGEFLVHDRETQTTHLFDFMCPAPAAYSPQDVPDQTKPTTTVGIPGFIHGLFAVHQRFGSLEWETLFGPALLLAAADVTVNAALKRSAESFPGSKEHPLISQMLSEAGTFKPSENLVTLLRDLSKQPPSDFFAGSFGQQLVTSMNKDGRHWNLRKDLIDYTVLEPKPLTMTFDGFMLTTFPPPVVGGVFSTLVLGNLDFMTRKEPLLYDKLRKNDLAETAEYLHRLGVLARFAEASVSGLGDMTDPVVGSKARTRFADAFTLQNREATLAELKKASPAYGDASGLPPAADSMSLGDLAVLATDASKYTVVATSMLGAVFGNGQDISGQFLNSALRLFSQQKMTNGMDILNVIAPGRRPLVPVAPMYMYTISKKCGIRVGLAPRGGLWGQMDLTQVVSNAVLFLQNVKCSGEEQSTFGGPQTASNLQTLGESPAILENCLPASKALTVPRLHNPLANNTATLLESSFDSALKAQLIKVSSTQAKVIPNWPGRVSLVGWNGYDLLTGMDPRGAINGLATF